VAGDGRRPGELNVKELLRWGWRQLTSMRTALLLLLLLAVAAIPGSIIPQNGVDSLKASQWRDAHPSLTPVYEKLGLFHVFSTPWFAAIYLLLLISLVGCFIPRIVVYAKALRARPPRTPSNLDRLPAHTEFVTDRSPGEVLDRADVVLARYRRERTGDSVSAERGYLREGGNLLFHVSVLVVLVGFAMTSLLGYKGGVIVIVGQGFANNLTQYDDFAPGALFDPDNLDDFSFDIKKFDVTWLTKGPAKGQARGFVSHLDYQEGDGPTKEYDLRVNHPLSIGDTELFLIGHGYAPVITVRDGNGDIAWSGPTIFLPEDQTFTSIGVVKAADAQPEGIGLRGWFYPTYAFTDASGPFSVMGQARNPAISMQVYAGDLGLDSGAAQSAYTLDTSHAQLVKKDDGKMFRVDLALGQKVELPHGLGSVSFDRLDRWNKLKISRTPGVRIALGGVLLALLGLLGSLFIRPRRAWVRARETEDGTLVEVAVLDRAGGDDVAPVLADIVERLKEDPRT
jgi:cytochrome c biogenesis protein